VPFFAPPSTLIRYWIRVALVPNGVPSTKTVRQSRPNIRSPRNGIVVRQVGKRIRNGPVVAEEQIAKNWACAGILRVVSYTPSLAIGG
jgi:hypothetical protein